MTDQIKHRHKHVEKESYTAGGIRLSQVVSETSSDGVNENGLDVIDEDPPHVEISLPEDTYSMILIARNGSSTQIFCVACIFFQFSLVILIVVSLVKETSTFNPFVVPIGVDEQVILAQALAVILAAFSAEDLLTALSFLFICVDDDVRQAIPEVTKARWILAFGSKALEGLLCLATIFLLIVQSETVISLCLNFAALSFVWNIDDMFYTLGRSGYFLIGIQESSNRLATTKIPLVHQNRIRNARNISFYFFMCIMFALWLMISIEQITGQYLCRNLLVQFDDVFDPHLSKFSGIYKIVGHSKNFYAIYEGPKGSTSLGYPIIRYCHSAHTWTLSEYKKGQEYSECDWLAKSPTTFNHDIMTVSSGWYANVKDSLEYTPVGPLPLEHMSIECLDCHNEKEPIRNSCNGRGTCKSDGSCECYEDNYGPSCEFPKPCEKLVTYNRPGYKYINGSITFQNTFDLLKNQKGEIVEVQSRPVYIQPHNPSPFAIYFDGYRWRMIIIDFNGTEAEGVAHAIELFTAYNPHMNLHMNDTVVHFSEPMLMSSSNDRSVPVFFKWYKTLHGKVDKVTEDIGSLVCEGCSKFQQCRHNGQCVNNRCVCHKCSEGSLCEVKSDEPACNQTEAVDFF